MYIDNVFKTVQIQGLLSQDEVELNSPVTVTESLRLIFENKCLRKMHGLVEMQVHMERQVMINLS